MIGLYSVKTQCAHESLRRENDRLRTEYTGTEKTGDTGVKDIQVQKNPGKHEAPFEVDFAALEEDGHNVAAWVFFPGTGINYPVAKGDDNEFYLTHSTDGSYNSYGCIFTDAACSGRFEEANTVLYGHHMADGTMFAGLTGFKSGDFFSGHSRGWVITPESCFRADIYSCYITYAQSDAYRCSFEDCDDYAAWLERTVENSLVPAETSPDVSCRILTMSTCSYEFPNARCVVHAVLTPQG